MPAPYATVNRPSHDDAAAPTHTVRAIAIGPGVSATRLQEIIEGVSGATPSKSRSPAKPQTQTKPVTPPRPPQHGGPPANAANGK